MNPLEWATSSLINLATFSLMATLGGWVIVKIGKTAIDNTAIISSSWAERFIARVPMFRQSLFKKVALRVVREIESEFKGVSGIKKKAAARNALKAIIPFISDRSANELIEYAVIRMNDVLKVVQVQIKEA